MKRHLIIAILSLGLLALIAGCSQKTSDSQNDQSEIADEFGGYTPTDEQPAFGDQVLAAEMEGDEEYNDQVLSSPTVDSIINDSEEEGAYALRIVWGSLEFDSTVTEVTDWSGSLTISRGAEIVRRLIRFERGQDYILPREDRKVIEWVSVTTVHYDGIFVNLYVPPVDPNDTNVTADEPVTVTFATGPFTVSFNIEELMTLDTVFVLEDGVNAVAFRGFKVFPGICPKGFLGGRWGKDSTGQGIFFGRWISRNGALIGHLRGHWGTDRDGNPDNVFYGKWIDINGKFEGFLKGHYYARPCPNVVRDRFGQFKGFFYDANRNVKGALNGHYMRSRTDEENSLGFFLGRWKTFCGEGNQHRWQHRDGIEGD
jgi:hypothetical protein